MSEYIIGKDMMILKESVEKEFKAFGEAVKEIKENLETRMKDLEGRLEYLEDWFAEEFGEDE